MRSKTQIIKLVVALSITLIIKSIGIEHIPYSIVLLILAFSVVYFALSIFKTIKCKRDDKYYTIFLINIIALAISTIILFSVPTSFEFLVNNILIPISVILLISTTISILAWAIVSNKK